MKRIEPCEADICNLQGQELTERNTRMVRVRRQWQREGVTEPDVRKIHAGCFDPAQHVLVEVETTVRDVEAT